MKPLSRRSFVKFAGVAGISALLAQSASGCSVAKTYYDAIVIGAGVIGCCTARQLARYTANILVCEAGLDIASGATRANSGVVHAGFGSKPGTLKARYNVAGAAAFPKWREELGFTYFQNGALVLAFNDEEMDTLHMLHEQGIQNGAETTRIINAAELRSLEAATPENAIGALYAFSSAIVDPYGLSLAALENAIDNGVELALSCKVTAIEKTSRGYDVTLNGNRVVACKSIVNAAGIHSDEINNLISGHRICMQPKRGEYLLYKGHSPFNCTVFQAPSSQGKGVLVGKTVFGNCFIGPNNVSQTSKNDVSTTEDGLSDVLEQARKTWPFASDDDVISTFAGLRASNAIDGDFIVGEAEDAPGFFNAACIDSPGLASAPAIASDIASAVARRLGLVENANFNPIRTASPLFAYADDETKRHLLESNPDYGVTVCKCYNVTKAEIAQALHGKIPVCALDALKWRCGAMMGPCQGSRCLADIIGIVANELQQDASLLVKREPASTFGVENVPTDVANRIDTSFDDDMIERSRASYLIPGARPAGIYSARSVVELIARNNLLPGENVAVWGETEWAQRAICALEACGARITRIDEDVSIVGISGTSRIDSLTVESSGQRRKVYCDALVISKDLTSAP